MLGPMRDGVYASRFPGPNDGAVYTLVNRGGANLTGQQLWIDGLASGDRVFDCYRDKS